MHIQQLIPMLPNWGVSTKICSTSEKLEMEKNNNHVLFRQFKIK